MIKIFRSRFFTMLLAGAVSTLLVLLCYMNQPYLLRMLDHKIYDALTVTQAQGPKTQVPIIIDLDEASLEAFGQWPWPRILVARLLDKLQENGVAAVGIDILLSEPDRSSPNAVRESLAMLLGRELDLGSLPESLRDYDRILADSLTERTVLGLNLQYGTSAGTPVGESLPKGVTPLIRKAPDARPWNEGIPTTGKATLPLPLFRDKAPMGLLDINPESDGIVRRVPLIGIYYDGLYPTLALRALMAALGQKNLILHTGKDGLESARVGNYNIPLLTDGTAMPRFQGAGQTYPYYSAGDILNNAVPRESLAGRIAFVGSSAPGLLDLRSTPMARGIAGVEIHAAMLDAILSGDFMHVPPWMPGAQALAIIACGLAATLAFALARPVIYIPLSGLLPAGAVYGSVRLFQEGIFASPLYVVVAIVLCGVFILALRFSQEERQKRVLRGAFSRYVAPEVVARITRLEGDLFGGEERELTIMFTDIRGFTSISEKLSPQEIVRLLNRYFTPMTNLVRSSKGTLDKFIGDALMAFWNAPLDVPGHAALGLSTALAMQETLGRINVDIQQDFGVTLAMGAGVHTGKAYVGNMGSEELLNYTLIGDNVNLASRLEGLCSAFGVGIVTSQETMEQALASPAFAAAPLAFQPLDTLRVKGKKQPVSVFTVFTPAEAEARRDELDLHMEAFEAYRCGKFTDSYLVFEDLARRYPSNKIYTVFLARLQSLIASPPEEWDGVWTMTGK